MLQQRADRVADQVGSSLASREKQQVGEYDRLLRG
jgi:hypothetical protein